MSRFIFACLLVLPGLVFAGEPAEGVALKVRRGFFTETDIGGFMTLGGDRNYSKVQTYLQLGFGYDVGDKLELGAHFGIGANADNCWAGRKGDSCIESDNFTVFLMDASLSYLFEVAPRFYVSPKIVGGYALLDPAPLYSPATGVDGKRKADAVPLNSGLNAGGGLSLEYATSMDHFSIGVDVLYRFIVGPNMHTVQFFPRVKYTF